MNTSATSDKPTTTSPAPADFARLAADLTAGGDQKILADLAEILLRDKK